MLGYAKPPPNLQLSVTSFHIRCRFHVTNKNVVGTTREFAASGLVVCQEVLYQVT